MSSIFLDRVNTSVNCSSSRNKHDLCKNKNGKCECDCHRIKELQRRLDEASQKSIQSHMEMLSQ